MLFKLSLYRICPGLYKSRNLDRIVYIEKSVDHPNLWTVYDDNDLSSKWSTKRECIEYIESIINDEGLRNWAGLTPIIKVFRKRKTVYGRIVGFKWMYATINSNGDIFKLHLSKLTYA